MLPCSAVLAGGNLAVNPGFDLDLSGWTPVVSAGASVKWISSGNPGGSAYASAPNPNTSAVITQCIDVTAPLTVDFLVDYYIASSIVSGGSIMQGTAYAGPACGSANLGNLPNGTLGLSPGGWGFRMTLAGAALPAGTHSVLLSLGCQSGAAAGSANNYYFDNVWFGSDIIFANGFGP